MVIKYPTLKNAPITEALLDIRLNLPASTTLAKLETFQKKIIKDFPERKTRVSMESQFKFGETGFQQSTSSHEPDGYLFSSSDKTKIVQARLDGFTFNKLKPYQDWATFSKEARMLWGHYLEIASPVNVTRLAVRYINKIEIPLPIKDFKEYIRTAPEIAPGISQELAGYFIRLVIPYPAKQSTAIVVETIEPPSGDKTILPLLFDIDVFKDIVLEPKDPKIWQNLGDLRDLKNTIFFESLTEKTIKMFK